jgi:SAM-dependent methyltransferase
MRFRPRVYVQKLAGIYNWAVASRDAGLEHELGFWDEWFKTKGLSWPEGYQARFDPELELSAYHRSYIDQLPQQEIHILDVGAGPLTILGRKHPNKRLTIVATDVLAAQYDRLLEKYNITPLIRTQYADAERLVEQFGHDRFDFVHAQNCIDHARDPIEAIKQMLYVVKPGCLVGLKHLENEGEYANYQGLHQWNFTIQHGRLILKSKFKRTNVAEAIAGLGQVECSKQDRWVIARIQKQPSSHKE